MQAQLTLYYYLFFTNTHLHYFDWIQLQLSYALKRSCYFVGYPTTKSVGLSPGDHLWLYNQISDVRLAAIKGKSGDETRVILQMSLKLVDMRAESSFRKGIAPAGDNTYKISLLILKNQVLYPFAQGFLWALFKDWVLVARLWASTSGSEYGILLRKSLSRFLSGWARFGKDAYDYTLDGAAS